MLLRLHLGGQKGGSQTLLCRDSGLGLSPHSYHSAWTHCKFTTMNWRQALRAPASPGWLLSCSLRCQRQLHSAGPASAFWFPIEKTGTVGGPSPGPTGSCAHTHCSLPSAADELSPAQEGPSLLQRTPPFWSTQGYCSGSFSSLSCFVRSPRSRNMLLFLHP